MSEDDDTLSNNGSFTSLPNILLFMYHELKYLLDIEFKESEAIVVSANNIIGWNGIIISVLLTGVGLFISSEKVSLILPELIMLSSTVILLGGSIVTVFYFQIRSPPIRIHSSSRLMDKLETENTADILGHLIEETYNAIQTNQKTNQLKRGKIAISQGLLLIAMLIAIRFLIYHMYILHMTDTNNTKKQVKTSPNNTNILDLILNKIKHAFDKEHDVNKHPDNSSLFMDRKLMRFR